MREPSVVAELEYFERSSDLTIESKMCPMGGYPTSLCVDLRKAGSDGTYCLYYNGLRGMFVSCSHPDCGVMIVHSPEVQP